MNFNFLAVLLATLIFAVLVKAVYRSNHRIESEQQPRKLEENHHLARRRGLTISGTFICGALLSLGLAQVTHLSYQVSSIPWFALSLFVAFVVWLSFISVSTVINSRAFAIGRVHLLQRLAGSLLMLLLMAVPIGLIR